ARRLERSALLPAAANDAPADRPLTRVDFFQAHTLCRLLGLVVAGDPGLFRLPMGTELELAAFGANVDKACNGAAARNAPVSMSRFLAAAGPFARGLPATAEQSRAAGDVAPTPFAAEFYGLDFGVREWVADLPHIAGADLLLQEWSADHEVHLAKVGAYADGSLVPPLDLAGPLRTLAVVRGLALGEIEGLLDESGRRLDPEVYAEVPASVPGVLRTVQLRRDGRDLLSTGPDPRLRSIGFRVAGTTALVARLRGLD
ncbi:MAG: hypothetical protein KDC98_18435, partial [Planctomycetes bacterium]|nr:hypothetical protein [Planctomycetota bacterium]